MWLAPLFLEQLLPNALHDAISALGMLVGIPFALIWIYFLSCFIILFYEVGFKKLKKVKLKKRSILAILTILVILILVLVLQTISIDPCAKETESEQASEGYSRPRDRCYWREAVETKNVLLCGKIGTNPQGIYSQQAKTLYNDLCYGYFCAIERQEDACDKIIYSDTKTEAVAIKNNDISYCHNIINADARNGCIGRVNGTYRYVVPD
jgi:hypothetical protein